MDANVGQTAQQKAAAARLWMTPTSEEDLPTIKAIPSGTKVFFRWANRTAYINVWGSSEARQKLMKQLLNSERLSKDEVQSFPNSSTETAPPFDAQFAAGDLFEPPFHSNVDRLSSSVIVLLSLVGLVFVLLLCYFLVRLLHGGEDDDNSLRRQEEGSPRLRELQVVLVPKKSCTSLPSALVHPFGFGDKKHSVERIAGLGHQPTNAARPFPRRIYELQAEEGYFSCPPSMRASFELD
uniref:Transmembrane protein n=1 Tax=Globodera rostochiensis TaxID=31243 RepID=A0A914H5S7_GLORO